MLALLALPVRLLATTANDLCMSSADPCIVSTPLTVQDQSVIDLGTRELRIVSGGVLDVGSGKMTLNAGTLTVQTSGFVRARGATTAGGTITVVTGSVTVAPDAPVSPTSPIDASGAPGGTIHITATGNISVAGSISARGLTPADTGGAVQLTAATATVSAPVSAAGGFNALGGSVEVDTNGGDLTVSSTLDASGGDPGGTVTVITTAGNLVVSNSGVLTADAIASGGSGGDIEFTVSGDGTTTGLATINGLLSAKGVAGSVTTGGGDGGTIDIEAAGDLHMDQASATVIADGGAPDGTGGDIIVLDDTGGMTMQGTVSAATAGPDSFGGCVCIETFTDLTVSGSILLMGGSVGGGAADLTSDSGSVSIANSGLITVAGNAGGAGAGGSISLCAAVPCSNGTDPTGVQGILVEGTLVADGGPGGTIALEGDDSVRVTSTGSLHASGGGTGGGTGGTLTATADSGIVSIEGPMTAAGGSPNGAGGVLSVNATDRISVSAPLDGSGPGNGGMVGIGSATTLGPIDVFSNITVASSAAVGGTIELMGEGDVIVAGTLVSTGVVAPRNSSQIGIDLLGCNVTLCGLDAQSCPVGSTGVLTSLGPSGVNRVTDRNSSGIFGTMEANQNSGSNELVYDGNVNHQPLVLGQVKPAAVLTVNATLMPCVTSMATPTNTPAATPTSTATGASTSTPTQSLTRTPTHPPCIGDCEGTHTVAINDLITLVNVALGSIQPSACPNGVPTGTPVNIALLIQAVNNALNGCSS